MKRKSSIISTIYNIYLLFPYDFATIDSVDDCIISSEEILKKALETSETLDGEKIVGANGSYSKEIFESIDETYTTLDITDEINDDLDFESTVLGSSWWDKLWGKEYTTSFDGIRGLEAVTAEHIALSDSELSSTLYISPTDIDDLRAEYNAKSSSETIGFTERIASFRTTF